MRTLRGVPCNTRERIIGRVSKRCLPWTGSDCILVSPQHPSHLLRKPLALLTSAPQGDDLRGVPAIIGIESSSLELLKEGDVVAIYPDGNVEQLWLANSDSNVLFMTHTCNCHCIMCPQPSRRDDDDFLLINRRILHLVRKQRVRGLCITGGEPTLRMDALCELIRVCRTDFPSTCVNLLTNGKILRDFDCAKRLALIGNHNLTYCVSLASDIPDEHDRIMDSKGCFNEVVRALQNLALLSQRLEIRIVIHKLNATRLPQMAEFIYRNFPFVAHTAWMVMETTGLAWQNLQQLWVDPSEYVPQLREAIAHLHRRNLDTSIYNMPLCMIPEPLWSFAPDSISDWKKTFLPVCSSCIKIPSCPGVFATSKFHSTHLHPISS